jgi:hypothetical protein
MANLAGYPGTQGYGFDSDRSLLVVSTTSRSLIYLVAGAGLNVQIDDESVATWSQGAAPKSTAGLPLSDWEKQQDIRVLSIKGLKTGAAVLNAFLDDGRPWIQPLQIQVVDNADRRQSGDKGKITPELRDELQGLSMRDAVVRVAQDQMNSAIGQSASGGGGRYDDAGINWCGSFVYWCYDQAARAKGVDNPFGSFAASSNPLRSGIKALSWGMRHPLAATVIQYEGPDRFAGKTTQELIEIGADNPVMAGDIALPRKNHGDTFPHVCMVLNPPSTGGGAFTSIDGNQFGAYRPDGSNAKTCIGTCDHNADDTLKIEGKTDVYKWVFVHLTGI